MRPFLYLILIFLISCSEKQSRVQKASTDTSQKNKLSAIAQQLDLYTIREDYQAFAPITEFPRINDTSDFIKQLKRFAEFELCAFPGRPEFKERITFYRRVKLNGSNKDYILCEYSYGAGCNAGFPWKYQLLFTPGGKLIATLGALRFQFLKVFPNQPPFLLTLISTARGNGGHQLFKISADTLENVYEGYTDYQTKTYDAYQDNAVYEPNELVIKVKDFNGDGYNDLAFVGKLVLIKGLTKDSLWYEYEVRDKGKVYYSVDNAFMKLPVQYVYVYNPKTGHFVENKKYTRKYTVE